MKKQNKKLVLVALALLAMVTLSLVGCKNDSVGEAGAPGGTLTPDNISSVIKGLTGEGPHKLVVTGDWSNRHYQWLKEALQENTTVKVELDFSKISGGKDGMLLFANVKNLVGITFPEGVTRIRSTAFSGCTGLTSITIPSSVTEIGSNAFWGCSNLTRVDVEAETPCALGAYVFYGIPNIKIYVPSSAVETYKAHYSPNEFFPDSFEDYGWSSYADQIFAATEAQ